MNVVKLSTLHEKAGCVEYKMPYTVALKKKVLFNV